MRGLGMASLLVLTTISAVGGTVAAVSVTFGKGASTCAAEPSSDEDVAPVAQHAVLKTPKGRALPMR